MSDTAPKSFEGHSVDVRQATTVKLDTTWLHVPRVHPLPTPPPGTSGMAYIGLDTTSGLMYYAYPTGPWTIIS